MRTYAKRKLAACRPLIRAAIGIGILAASTLGAAASATAAAADIVDLTCTGSSRTTYQPGMTVTVQPTMISGSGSYMPCASGDPSLVSGTFKASGTGSVSCFSGMFSGSITFTWNNGRSSTVSYTAVIAQRTSGEVIVLVDGSVVEGEFDGDTFTHTVTLFTLVPEQCFTSAGVTSTSGPETITFTRSR